MNAQVLSTRTSAPLASSVSSAPASASVASMCSESTRFLGQPRWTTATFLPSSRAGAAGAAGAFIIGKRTAASGVHLVEQARVGDALAHVLELADPGHHALHAEPEARVRHRSVAAHVEV